MRDLFYRKGYSYDDVYDWNTIGNRPVNSNSGSSRPDQVLLPSEPNLMMNSGLLPNQPPIPPTNMNSVSLIQASNPSGIISREEEPQRGKFLQFTTIFVFSVTFLFN